ncbi:MAG: hypothetical protein IPP65_12035 [Chlorobi bacterium]|nr:hypothetical protein [Chlorobiota bacterium]
MFKIYKVTLLILFFGLLNKTYSQESESSEKDTLKVPLIEIKQAESNNEIEVTPTITYSIANEFRAGAGSQFDTDNNELKKEYLENVFNTKFNIGNFNFGFKAELDKPREQGRDTIGISSYFVEFTKDNIKARGGNFYNLIGRGLVMNTYESRPIGFNTETQGAKVDYEDENISASLFGGILSYAPIIHNSRFDDYLLRGGSGEYRPISEIALGGSYLAVSALKNKFLQVPYETFLREGYLKANYDNLSCFFNYAYKNSPLDSSAISDLNGAPINGYGIYGMLGYNNEDFGLNFEYKDYSFDIVHPDLQQNPPLSTRVLPIQQPPTLIPEHDKALLARNPHQQEVNDEVGIMVSGSYNVNEKLSFSGVFSAGSRHFGYNLVNNILVKSVAESRILPSFSDSIYSPYSEIFLSSEFKLNSELSFIGGVQLKKNYIYTEPASTHPSKTEKNESTTLMLASFIELSESTELHAILELQQAFESKKKAVKDTVINTIEFDGHFNNIYLVFEYTASSKLSFNSRIEYSTVKNEQNQQSLWPVLGFTYRIGNTHNFGLQYGSERGGVVCTGGVCRTVNPFTGFRVNLTSKL